VNRGSYVSPATAILEIVDNNHIHLELSVFEKDVLQVKRGQSIRFRIPESSKKNYKAEVHLMGTVIEENRTIKVHGHINDESEENFLTGMFVDADIITASTSAKAVPQTAIVEREGKKMIVLMDEKTETGYYFKPVEIEIGASYNGNVALKTINVEMDLKPILVKGAFSVIAD
jgi:cobalt-zinc-cadmium efflux system membrane fusion protein